MRPCVRERDPIIAYREMRVGRPEEYAREGLLTPAPTAPSVTREENQAVTRPNSGSGQMGGEVGVSDECREHQVAYRLSCEKPTPPTPRLGMGPSPPPPERNTMPSAGSIECESNVLDDHTKTPNKIPLPRGGPTTSSAQSWPRPRRRHSDGGVSRPGFRRGRTAYLHIATPIDLPELCIAEETGGTCNLASTTPNGKEM